MTTEGGDGSAASTTQMGYDIWGDMDTVLGPVSPNFTRTFYDMAHRLLGSVTNDPDDTGPLLYPATRITYNADSQVIETEQGTGTSTDPTTWSFNSLTQQYTAYDSTTGAKIKDSAAIGGPSHIQSVTQYNYDAAGNLNCTAVREDPSLFSSLPTNVCLQSGTYPYGTFGADQITQNTYDNANRMTFVQSGVNTSAPKTEVKKDYTPNSKVAWVEDGNENRSAYTYGGLDRMVQLNYPSKTTTHTPSTTDYEQFSYDNNGNVLHHILRSGQDVGFSYDDVNNLVFIDYPTGTTTRDVAYKYDLLGRLLYSHYDSSTGPGVDYTYDPLGRKITETTYGNKVTSQYDAAGNRTRLIYPDSIPSVPRYIDYTYDVLNRMRQVKENGSTVLAEYSYDDLGRVTEIDRSNSAVTTASYGSTTQDWSLTQNVTSTGDDVTYSMAYSPAAQLHQRGLDNPNYAYSAPAASVSYSRNGLNQYTNTGTSLNYDDRGNLTYDGSRTLQYDLTNHLRSISGSPTISIDYDPLGRMQAVAAPGTTQYLYDGDRLVVEYDNSGNILRRYVPGQGADETLVWYEGSNLSSPRWLHTDQQGSTIAITNSSGAQTVSYDYSASGEPNSWASAGPSFRYTGQVSLPAAQLYYYKARMYDPGLGRFLQTDPISYDGGMNLYAYAGNDPANNADPSGLCDVYQFGDCSETVIDTGYRNKPTTATASPLSGPAFLNSGGSGSQPAIETVTVTGTRPNGTNYLRPTPEGPSDDDDGHERARKADFNTCRGLMGAALRSACYQSAGQRDYARRNGKPLPPLITQLFSPLPQGARAPNPSVLLGVGGVGAAAVCVALEPCGAAVGSAFGLTGLGILILQ